MDGKIVVTSDDVVDAEGGCPYGTPTWLDTRYTRWWSDPQNGVTRPRTYKEKIAIFMPGATCGMIEILELVENGHGLCMFPYHAGHTLLVLLWREEDTALADELIQAWGARANRLMRDWAGSFGGAGL
jgi:hypothetical protein